MATNAIDSFEVSDVDIPSFAGMDLEFWRTQLGGKRVCVVGNARTIEPPRIPVDRHDIIFRFNDFTLGGPMGSRTDFYCTTLRKEVRTSPESMRTGGCRPVITSRHSHSTSDLSWAIVGHALERSLGCWPSSGLMAVQLACACEAAHVTLTAMTLAPSLARDPAWSPRYAPPCAWHNFLGERRVLAGLLRGFEGVMDLPPALDALRHVAATRPDSYWEGLASLLAEVGRLGVDEASPAPHCGELSARVRALLCGADHILSDLAPSMDGVERIEPFFYLPSDNRRYAERWLLFHAVGAGVMDEILERLRGLQTLCR